MAKIAGMDRPPDATSTDETAGALSAAADGDTTKSGDTATLGTRSKRPIARIAGRLASPPSPLSTNRRRLLNTFSREAAGIAAAVVAYPLGLVEEAIDSAGQRTHAPPLMHNPMFHLNPGAYDIPVLLIHGYAHNHSAYWLLKNRLRKIGFTHVYSINYNPWLNDVPTVAKRIGKRVEKICDEAGQPYVHLVGHSMGGIASRHYVQLGNGDERVHRVIMIGSPHNGTYAASTMKFMGKTARQLGWNSPMFRELNEAEPDGSVRYTSIWSSSDELVVPAESARLCPVNYNAENIHVPGEGHLSLLFSHRVHDIVLDRLCDVDELPKLAHDPYAANALTNLAAGASSTVTPESTDLA